jgi:hypothetical protein
VIDTFAERIPPISRNGARERMQQADGNEKVEDESTGKSRGAGV